MKFGINCTFTDRSTITPAEYGRAVEARGFDSIFLAEHTHIPVTEVSPTRSVIGPPRCTTPSTPS
jgi:alkanesulfonate monooxygenase SsuD/methylene tetrahydromethanopterin reductase-like flavin-dependent oxidoreductase (luciferase family)